ncbi:MAG: RNA polymerase sigma factor [Gemmataceae bacterium]
MSGSPTTRKSLLIRLKQSGDEEAWSQFVEVYAPLVHAYGLHHGLQDADAADLAQEVLQIASAQVGEFDYDPRQGSFRGWLYTVTRNKLRTILRKRRSREEAQGGANMQRVLLNQPDTHDDEEHWNRQHEQHLFTWATERVRKEFNETTWFAFWRTAVENFPPAAVAEQLGLSVGAVYVAKSRVLARLRSEIEAIED